MSDPCETEFAKAARKYAEAKRKRVAATRREERAHDAWTKACNAEADASLAEERERNRFLRLALLVAGKGAR